MGTYLIAVALKPLVLFLIFLVARYCASLIPEGRLKRLLLTRIGGPE